MKILSKYMFLGLAILSVNACSGILPVPGGRSTVNHHFYQSNAELKERLSELKIGMTKEEVFSQLGREREDLLKLDRQGIINALYGGQNSPYTLGSANNPYKDINIKSLSGYQLNYSVVKLKHGLKSPISIRTDEIGHDYKAVMIFENGKLFEDPMVSGGLIDNTRSRTVFDYLNPGMIMKHAGL